MSGEFSYLGRAELSYLTQKFMLAAQEIKREEAKRKLLELKDKLVMIGDDSPKLAELRTRLEKLHKAIGNY